MPQRQYRLTTRFGLSRPGIPRPGLRVSIMLVAFLSAGACVAVMHALGWWNGGSDSVVAVLSGLATAAAMAFAGGWALARRVEQAERALIERAMIDPLTGLANREPFVSRVEEAIRIAHRSGGRVALLFLDCDAFKPVNDRFGHAVGDAVIAEVARRLPPLLRAGDLAARVGGDEFALLIHSIAGAADADIVAHRVAEAMAQPIVINGERLTIALSCGIALYPNDGADAAALLAHADQQMYAHKARGR